MSADSLQAQLAAVVSAKATADQTGPALIKAQADDAAARAAVASTSQQFLADFNAYIQAAPGLLVAPVGAAPVGHDLPTLAALGDGRYLRALTAALDTLTTAAQKAGLKVGHGEIVAAAIEVALAVVSGTPFTVAIKDALAKILPGPTVPPPNPVPNADSYGDVPPA